MRCVVKSDNLRGDSPMVVRQGPWHRSQWCAARRRRGSSDSEGPPYAIVGSNEVVLLVEDEIVFATVKRPEKKVCGFGPRL